MKQPDNSLPAQSETLQALWDLTLAAIKESVGETAFELWFTLLRPLSLHDNVLTVGQPNRFYRDYLADTYPGIIKEHFTHAYGRVVNIEYEIYESHAIEDDAKEVAAQMATALAGTESLRPEQCSLFAPVPTDMCRVSPFFPLSKSQLKKRDFLRDLLISAGNWGEISYTGPRLSVYEEDALDAFLAVLSEANHREKVDDGSGRTTYKYQGPALPILRLMGYTSPNKKEYQGLIESLKLLQSAVVHLTTYKHDTRGKRGPRVHEISNMLSRAQWDEEAKELVVVINPYFYECFMDPQRRITLIDVQRRAKLKSPIAKCLYRFVESHSNDAWSGDFLKLAEVLNMDLQQPKIAIRRYLKKSIAELIKNQILTSKSCLAKSDRVYLYRRSKEAVPKQVPRS